MYPTPIPKILDALNGDLLRGPFNGVVTAVTTDSRGDVADHLFVPLVGEKFDGHEFIEDVASRGATGALTSKPISVDKLPAGFIVIRVADTLNAYQSLGTLNRKAFSGPVIAVTGSCGKTTTKNMIRNILDLKHKAVFTERNENNEIGAAHTLLRIDRDTNVVVLEMGMRGPGEIDQLAKMSLPTIGCITNVEKTHIGRLGSEEAIASAKGELLDSLSEGVGILNADNRWTPAMRCRLNGRLVTFGLEAAANVTAEDMHFSFDGVTFILKAGTSFFPVELSIPGKMNVYNALAAAACALEIGLGPDTVAEGLRRKIEESGRLRRLHSLRGNIILDDTYNSNPASLAMALEMLGNFPWSGRKVAILGDMLELGDYSASEHRRIGEQFVPAHAGALVAFGPEALHIAEGAMAAGMPEDSVLHAPDFETFAQDAKKRFQPSDLILVKGSRGMKMERIVDWLMEL